MDFNRTNQFAHLPEDLGSISSIYAEGRSNGASSCKTLSYEHSLAALGGVFVRTLIAGSFNPMLLRGHPYVSIQHQMLLVARCLCSASVALEPVFGTSESPLCSYCLALPDHLAIMIIRCVCPELFPFSVCASPCKTVLIPVAYKVGKCGRRNRISTLRVVVSLRSTDR